MPSFQDPVTIVLLIFGFIVSSALERFLSKTPMLAHRRTSVLAREDSAGAGSNRALRWADEVFYWSSFAVLISVVLRFFIGASAHLSDTYVVKPHPLSPSAVLLLFDKDLIFLIAFGVFLVRLALSARAREFVFWLIMFFGSGIVWCLLEMLARPYSCIAYWWFLINSISLIITILCRWLLVRRPNRDASIFAGLGFCCVIIFLADLGKIMGCRAPLDGGA